MVILNKQANIIFYTGSTFDAQTTATPQTIQLKLSLHDQLR